jgi:hypothetical protein
MNLVTLEKMKRITLKDNSMRTWTPKTPLQKILFDTYKTKENACIRLGVTQPTLRKLFLNENELTFTQLRTLSEDSKISIIKIIKTL